MGIRIDGLGVKVGRRFGLVIAVVKRHLKIPVWQRLDKSRGHPSETPNHDLAPIQGCFDPTDVVIQCGKSFSTVKLWTGRQIPTNGMNTGRSD